MVKRKTQRRRFLKQKGAGFFNRVKGLFTRKKGVVPLQNKSYGNAIAPAVAGVYPILPSSEFKFNYTQTKSSKNSDLNLKSDMTPLLFETFPQVIPGWNKEENPHFYLRIIPINAKVKLKEFPSNPYLEQVKLSSLKNKNKMENVFLPQKFKLYSYIEKYLTNYYKPIMDKFGDFGPLTPERIEEIAATWKQNLFDSIYAIKRSVKEGGAQSVEAHIRNVPQENNKGLIKMKNVLYNNSTTWNTSSKNAVNKNVVIHRFPITHGEYNLGTIELTIELEFMIPSGKDENIVPPLDFLGQVNYYALQKLLKVFPEEDEMLFMESPVSIQRANVAVHNVLAPNLASRVSTATSDPGALNARL